MKLLPRFISTSGEGEKATPAGLPGIEGDKVGGCSGLESEEEFGSLNRFRGA